MSTVRVIDHILWPIVSKRWAYIIVLVLAWATEMPVISLAQVVTNPISAMTLAVVGTILVVVAIWTLVESRDRFVLWRNREMSRRGRW